jgi:hypothetical protein
MKKFAIAAVVFLSLLGAISFARTLKIPKRNPVASVVVPDSWEPEETDDGYAIESPDQVATVFLEVTSKKGMNDLIEENVDWLANDQKVKIDAGSKSTQDFETGDRKWGRVSWEGTSKEWGKAVVGFLFTEVGKGKVMTVTYWITKKDSEKHLPTLEKIFSSVKSIEEKENSSAKGEEYSFKVHNKSENKIKQILVSEDKKTWGKFDIGKGIAPGKTATLVWDKSTNKEACKQWVKAVYDDDSESKPAKFDFCESDLEIEFED